MIHPQSVIEIIFSMQVSIGDQGLETADEDIAIQGKDILIKASGELILKGSIIISCWIRSGYATSRI